MIKPSIDFFIILLSILVLSNTTCPGQCSTCDNPTSCSACNDGFFLVNGTFCAKCPFRCLRCVQGANGRSSCTLCMGKLTPDGQCFQCDPSCGDCARVPKNCTGCLNGKVLLPGINGTRICGQNPNCTISNCGQCGLDPLNQTVCTRCLPGFFPFRQNCIQCKFPCQDCVFDFSAVWTNIIAPFWNNTIRIILNISTPTPPPGVLPAFVNDLDFINMTAPIKMGWAEAFWLVKVLQPFVPEALLGTLIPAQIQFVNNTLLNLTGSALQDAILRQVNTVLSKTWTQQAFNTLIAQTVAGFTFCGSCSPGFQNNTNVSSPIACQRCQPNCLLCNAGFCSRCENGFFVDGSHNCSPCTAPCATCSGNGTTCFSCTPPNTLVGSVCMECQPPCSKCAPNNASVCTQCRAPLSLIPTADGVCFRCTQDLCTSCLQTNVSICLQCKPGSTIFNGTCKVCPSNCAQCSTTVPPICFRCLVGMTLAIQNNITTCIGCGAGCLQCEPTNSSICFACQLGTFLNQDIGACQRCARGCQQCTSLTACTKFSAGIVVISGQVVTCRPGCKTCDATSPDVCTVCQPRYFLSSSICRLCSPGCQQCSSPTVCTRCIDNLNLVNDTCVRCAPTCRTCTANITECTSCIIGFVLNDTQCVQACQRGCVQCSATNTSICTNCLPGHALRQDGRCVKCLGSCSGRCDPRNITICLGCGDGFQLLNNQCVRCPPGCATCFNGQCVSCVHGFILNQTTSGALVCQRQCQPPCAVCSGSQCSVCNPGFSLINNRCTPDLSCNPSCQFCPPGTQKLANGTCSPCSSNCASCSNGTCLACQGGFYLANGTCTTCPSQCFTCFDANTCDRCSDGYVKQVISMDSTGIANAVLGDQCIQCSSNCKTCQVDPNQCTSCPDGFRLFSSRCAGLFNVNYQYQLNINYAVFLQNSTSNELISAITAITGVDFNDTYITFVRQGSTVVGGSISANSQSAANGIQSSLGNSLSGFDVLSSSISIYYGDSAYTAPPTVEQEKKVQSKPNVGLIVGVVVGSVVLIAIAIFLIYKFKCQKAESAQVFQGSQMKLGHSRQESNTVVLKS